MRLPVKVRTMWLNQRPLKAHGLTLAVGLDFKPRCCPGHPHELIIDLLVFSINILIGYEYTYEEYWEDHDGE